jgi:hypothetical protein
MATSNSPFQRRYPPELRERAVRMVREAIAESGERNEYRAKAMAVFQLDGDGNDLPDPANVRYFLMSSLPQCARKTTTRPSDQQSAGCGGARAPRCEWRGGRRSVEDGADLVG